MSSVAQHHEHAPAHARPIAARTVGLSKTYGKGDAQVVALDDVSVDFEQGRFTAVMGPSGSGKSTLMHCAAALDRADRGQVFIGEQEITGLKDKALTRLRRDRIGFIFQAFNLVPTLSAKENILLPLAIAGRKPDQAWYDTVISTTGLGDRLRHRPSELSGGQQQRVAIARAMAMKPELMLFDEPTSALDPELVGEVLSVLKDLAREGMTMIVVTHEMGFAREVADHIVFIDGGVVVEAGSPDQVIDNPKSDRLRGFIDSVL